MSAALGWVGLAVALLGVASYFVVLVRRPHLVRILNGSGLLLSGLALTQAPALMSVAAGPQAFSVSACVVLLSLGVLAQAVAALRNRRAWDGSERRAGMLEGRA